MLTPILDLYYAPKQSPPKGSPYFLQVALSATISNPALYAAMKHFNWSSVAVFYQEDPNDIRLAESFISLAQHHAVRISSLLRSCELCMVSACDGQVQVVFQERQSPTAGDEQLQRLIRSETNIFLLFGGHGAQPRAIPSQGHGCAFAR